MARVNSKGIGGHQRAFRGETDVWLTPPEILEALSPFDLDPCAPIDRPWNTAKKHFTVDDNGLLKPWHGFVWLNPPYGPETGEWLRRLSAHGDGIALVFARTETRMFHQYAWRKATAMRFLMGRIHFHMPDGSLVRLCIMMARQPDDKREEPAIKHDGYAQAAVVSIIPYKQRVDKRADAEIIIDERLWDGMTDMQQRALLDHQITCIDLQVDENGAVKTDDVGRPKLTLRNCDWHLMGFESIARRYGADAYEVKAARDFQDKFGKFALEQAPEQKDAEQQTIFAER